MFVEAKSLPALEELREISGAQRGEFKENGHFLTRNLVSADEMGLYRPLILEAVKMYRTEKRRIADRDTYGKAFLQVMNLWTRDEGVRQFVLAKRFARIAADLLGVSNVRIYHDQALFKEPGGGPTPWHQDQFYWPLDTHNTITMWMPLVDISLDMGMLTFASGSHHNGIIFDHSISDESDNQLSKYIKKNRFPVTRPAGMRAGDASWHYGTTVHNAPANESDRMREVMTIIYMADGARVAEPRNKWQVDDWKTWLMGLPPGRLAASALNPLVL
ncbi:MAG TPA: phytanoyl-CoA dioxygenase family protein [Puia sp.]|nr:phytanoyl-CoA dioxygenase family protein [Puia sp.]